MYSFINKNFLLFIFSFLPYTLIAQPTLSLDWLDLQPEGFAIKIKKDSKENAIVLARGDGNPYYHIITLKYNKAGALLWKKIYVDPLNSFPDFPEDIEVDSLDNIYVTGTVNYDGNGIVLNSRSILLKYDSLGNLKWKQEYGSNTNLLIEGGAWSLKIHKNKYIYVAGHVDSANGNGFWKSLLLQYDSSGALLWTHIDSNSFQTFASRVLVDNIGNSYLCGNTTCCLPGYNMFVKKFDLTGSIIWQTVVDEPFHSFSYTHTSLLDDSSNIFLTGYTYGTLTGTGYDSYIAKIDSAGHLKWTNTLFKDSGVNVFGRVTDIVLDSSQNIYSFGTSGFQPNVFNYLQKIDNQTGINNWVQWNDTLGLSKGILSSKNSLVFTGNDTASNLVLKSIDTAGVLKWKYQFFCQCGATDMFELNNSLILAGQNYEPFTSNEDSIMTCRINFDSTLSILPTLQQYLNVFPNPVSSILNISQIIEGDHLNNITIFDIYGNRIYFEKIGKYISIDTINWQDGIYLIVIQSEKNIYRQKFIKLK